MDFSTDGHYMALAERRDCKDYISIFVCDDWHLLRVSILFFLTKIQSTYCEIQELQGPRLCPCVI